MKTLFFDDDEERHKAFKARFAGIHEVTHAYTPDHARACLDATRFDLVCLDHDMDMLSDTVGSKDETGLDVAEYIALHLEISQQPKAIIIHSWNPEGAKRIAAVLAETSINVSIKPFKC